MPFEERWERLLDAAVEVFAVGGISGASLGAVAERAGINRALVYEHVKAKPELFAAAVLRERERLVTWIAERYDETSELPLHDRVRRRFRVVIDYAEVHPVSVKLLALPDATRVLHDAGRAAAPADLSALLTTELARAGRPIGRSADVLAAMIVGMVNEVLAQGAGASWDTDAVVDLLAEFTLAGLAGLSADSLARADAAPAAPGVDEET
jgi:AcrR family transcriptional regulator